MTRNRVDEPRLTIPGPARRRSTLVDAPGAVRPEDGHADPNHGCHSKRADRQASRHGSHPNCMPELTPCAMSSVDGFAQVVRANRVVDEQQEVTIEDPRHRGPRGRQNPVAETPSRWTGSRPEHSVHVRDRTNPAMQGREAVPMRSERLT